MSNPITFDPPTPADSTPSHTGQQVPERAGGKNMGTGWHIHVLDVSLLWGPRRAIEAQPGSRNSLLESQLSILDVLHSNCVPLPYSYVAVLASIKKP